VIVPVFFTEGVMLHFALANASIHTVRLTAPAVFQRLISSGR
jgi:hypothetical protein